MENSEKLAEKILSAKKCGDVFSCCNIDTVKSEYYKLALKFHPDICTQPEANRIMSVLNEMYTKALDLIEHGTWEESNVVEFHDANGKRYVGKFLREMPFELGTTYISDYSVTYVFNTQYEKFFNNAVRQIKALRYANKDMEKEISRYMPHVIYSFKTTDSRYCMIVRKTPDVFMLSDISTFFCGKIPDRHVAWIVSRLCNLCCYFEYVGIAQNGMTLDTCFISPEFHTVLPLGGWWYTQNVGEKMIGVPRVIYDVMSVKSKSEKISSIATDLEASKLIGRQIIDMAAAPKEIVSFLNAGSSGNAKAEFAKWNKALDSAYGKRQFVEMKIDKSDIYK